MAINKLSAVESAPDGGGQEEASSPDNNGNSAPQAPVQEPPATESAKPQPKQYDLSKNTDQIELIRTEDEKRIRVEIGKYLRSILAMHGLNHYTTILLHDRCDSIAQYHADQIYKAATAANREKDILLIVQSAGGAVEPAYLISKICARLAKVKFVVAVPRRAKSAATLIALGADEIHMGLMSELGPVDPQIDGYPALGLINSLHVLAEIVCKNKDSAELFARYMSRNLDLRHLGYFVRVPESAVQYGERLLKRNEAQLPEGATAHSVANRLVNDYKDHSFVIDMDEATQLLGNLVRFDTPEYRAANEIYEFLDWMEFWLRALKKKDYWCVGDVDSGGTLRAKQ